MLKCYECQEIKNESHFNKNKTNKRGFQYKCNECRTVERKGKYRENKESGKPSRKYDPKYYHYENIKENIKRRNTERKALILKTYGNKCECCGEFLPEFLTIDHINGNGAEERKRGLKGNAFYRHIVKNNFPKEYRILCMNCNFSMGVHGYCPHQKQGEKNGTKRSLVI